LFKNILKLCLLTHCSPHNYFTNYNEFILLAIKGGVTSIQLRDKTSSYESLRTKALKLQTLLKPLNIPLIINDNVQLAKEIDADGVHLGQKDSSPEDARAILGENKIIGWSIETMEQLQIANQSNAINYIAASAVFSSHNKKNCNTIWGLDGLKAVSQNSLHPVVAIGGINIDNVEKVITQGAAGIAVISALHDHPDPEFTAKQLSLKINAGLSYV